ncbi:MAG: Rieske (2Fe-2S) protein [Alphaproteobacteria bacterium]|nr:Rieske (2Fe-2S) protein [Alphaproteobacteria bacterium]
MEWIEAFEAGALEPGGVRVVRHAGHQIAVFHRGADGLVAVDNRCPHEGYPLSQGTICGNALTCCWHNFKFDLTDGSCEKGEALVVHRVREVDGKVLVGLVEPDPAEAIAARWTSWTEAMFEEREGQALRDTVRLLQLGVPAAQIAAAIARWDAERGPWGLTHGAVTAAEVLTFCGEGPEAVVALAVPLQQAMRSHVRRHPRPEVAPEAPGPDAGSALLARVEAEDVTGSEALLRGMLAAGWGRDALEPLFWRMCAAHFLDFGHPAIYTAGLFDLVDRVGWAHAPSILVGLLHNVVGATREDVLPGWSRFREMLASVPVPEDRGVPWGRDTWPPPSVPEALEAVREAFAAGASWDALADWLVDLAADRVLAFDTAIDASSEVQDNWLSVTHCFTFAHAVRQGMRQPDGWRLLVQSARMSAHHRVLDGPLPTWSPREGDVDGLIAALRRGDAQDALDRAAWLVANDREGLHAGLRAYAVADPVVRGIWAVHVVKSIEAAFRERSDRPVLAVVRFLAAPKRERGTERTAREALRFVLEGKTPKLLAP